MQDTIMMDFMTVIIGPITCKYCHCSADDCCGFFLWTVCASCTVFTRTVESKRHELKTPHSGCHQRDSDLYLYPCSCTCQYILWPSTEVFPAYAAYFRVSPLQRWAVVLCHYLRLQSTTDAIIIYYDWTARVKRGRSHRRRRLATSFGPHVDPLRGMGMGVYRTRESYAKAPPPPTSTLT